ncbi:MAG: hypothetical protein IPP48_01310 [Chitinophagaceae bacterium]|nr:hypothetical protein [Chitinophagaceae bacterium]
MAFGDILLRTKKYSLAIEYYEKAKPYFIQQKNDSNLAQILKSTADAYRAGSFMRKAFENYREALPYLRSSNQLKLLNECQDAMGDLVLNFRDPANAVTFLSAHYN